MNTQLSIKLKSTVPSCSTRSAREPDEQGLIYNNNGTRLLEVTQYQTRTVVKEGVEIICDDVFYDTREYLEEIQLPQTLRQIGERTFANCEKLTAIQLPDSLISIDCHAFHESGLESIDIPDSVIYIGQNAFGSCKSLTTLKLPANLESIAHDAFLKCSHLSSVSMGNSANFTLEDGILYNKEKTTLIKCFIQKKHIVIPSTVTKIAEDAFAWCQEIETVQFSPSLTIIDDFAFTDCSSLKAVILPDSVTFIGWYAFQACSNLDFIQLPDGLQKMCTGAFVSCKKISTLVLPEKLPEHFSTDPFGGDLFKEIRTKSNRYRVEKYVVYDNETQQPIAYFE